MKACSEGGAYPGTENLEVMAEAVRYNEHLLGLVRRHAPDGGQQVMDFGAGAGTFAQPLAAEGMRVTCIEPDADLRSRLEAMGLRAVPSLEGIPRRSFAMIYSLNVLEHIQDDRTVLSQLRECLSDEGILLLYVPAFQVLFSSMDRRVGHFRRYRKAGLASLLRCAGYDVQESRYVDSIGFLAGLAYRMAGRDGKLNRRAVAFYDRWVFPGSLVLDRLLGRWLGKNLVVVARPIRTV